MCERSERTQATQRNGVGLNELLDRTSLLLKAQVRHRDRKPAKTDCTQARGEPQGGACAPACDSANHCQMRVGRRRAREPTNNLEKLGERRSAARRSSEKRSGGWALPRRQIHGVPCGHSGCGLTPELSRTAARNGGVVHVTMQPSREAVSA